MLDQVMLQLVQDKLLIVSVTACPSHRLVEPLAFIVGEFGAAPFVTTIELDAILVPQAFLSVAE